MKPVISYYGGKQRLASKLIPLIPKHTVYVEPFAGGAALLFAKPYPNVTSTGHYREVINDTDERLINFYRVLRDPQLGPELVRRLQLTLHSKAEHDWAWEILNDVGSSPLDRAWAYYVNIQMSFNNVLGSGWKRGVYGANPAAKWANKVAGLPQYLERMASVHIECLDAIECIKKWDSPQTFFYCDPPYPGAEQGHYSYTQEQFEELCSVLDKIDGSFLLSCYDNPAANKYNWERFEFNAYCSASGKGTVGDGRDKSRKATPEELGDRARVEVVWRKLRSKPVRPEIESLFRSGAFDCFRGDAILDNPHK